MNTIQSKGLNSLVSTPSLGSPPLPCRISIKENLILQHITVRLEYVLQHFNEASIYLDINPEILEPSSSELSEPKVALSEQLCQIGRLGSTCLQMLSLHPKEPCTIWCPVLSVDALDLMAATLDDLAADPGVSQLVGLSRATSLHILFDMNWLQPNQKTSLRRLVSGKVQLHAFPLGKNFLQRHGTPAWAKETPADIGPLPPAYDDDAEASNKRHRQGRDAL
jgi:hypothetical protein